MPKPPNLLRYSPIVFKGALLLSALAHLALNSISCIGSRCFTYLPLSSISMYNGYRMPFFYGLTSRFFTCVKWFLSGELSNRCLGAVDSVFIALHPNEVPLEMTRFTLFTFSTRLRQSHPLHRTKDCRAHG